MGMNLNPFISELSQLCRKHSVMLSGNLRVLRDGKHVNWLPDSQTIALAETMRMGSVTDKTGPFITFGVDPVPSAPVQARNDNLGFQYSADYKPYDCPVTGKIIDGRRDHRENLKRTGCRILEKGEKERHAKDHEARMEMQYERNAEKMTAHFVERAESAGLF